MKEEIERAKLPDGFVRPITDRVEDSLQRRAGKQQKFSTYQSLTHARRRRSSGTAPTGSRCSPRRAGARSRCASTGAAAICGRRSPAGPATLVFRNGEFELLGHRRRPQVRRRLTPSEPCRARLRAASARSAAGSTSSVCTPRPIDAVLVVQARLGHADAVRLRPRARLEAHPLADRMPVHVHRHLGVDRGRVREAQRVADAAAEVGARPRRARSARSARPRRPGTAAGTTRCPGPAPSSCRARAARRARSRSRSRPRRTGTSARSTASGGGGASTCGCTEPLVSTSSQRMRNTVARATSCSPLVEQRRFEPLHLACPGRIVRTRSSSGASGTGRSSSTVTRATNAAGPGIVLLAHRREQRARRAAVQRLRVPRPTRERRRHVAVAVALEQRAVRRDRIVITPRIVRPRFPPTVRKRSRGSPTLAAVSARGEAAEVGEHRVRSSPRGAPVASSARSSRSRRARDRARAPPCRASSRA